MVRRKIKNNIGFYIGKCLIYVIVGLIALMIILPMWFVFTTSISTEVAYLRDGIGFWPKELTGAAYKLVFGKQLFVRSLGNSIWVTLVGSVLSLAATALLAYPLSKTFLPGRHVLMFVLYMSGLFNGGVIPTWLIVKMTGLYDTLWSLIIALMIMPWIVVLLRNLLQGFPREIEEAAEIDGAGVMQVFVSIVLPMSLPALATTFMYYVLFRWNDWFNAIVFIQDRAKWPLQVFLRDVLLSGSVAGGSTGQDTSIGIPAETYKMAMVVVSTVPVMLIFPFVQRFFVKGLTAGGVKG